MEMHITARAEEDTTFPHRQTTKVLFLLLGCLLFFFLQTIPFTTGYLGYNDIFRKQDMILTSKERLQLKHTCNMKRVNIIETLT
jgi:hypothetical protein